ncbi:hypothetical protein AB6A23_07900 [Paenibacillus tarimensis]
MLKGKSRHALYASLAVTMIVVAIPRLDFGQGWTPAALFGAVWIIFALLVVAANLHALLGVDEQMQRELGRIRRAKRLMWQHKLQQRNNRSTRSNHG